MCGRLSPGLSKLGCCPATAPAGVLHLGARWVPPPPPPGLFRSPARTLPARSSLLCQGHRPPRAGAAAPLPLQTRPHGACTFHTCTVLHPSSCLGEPQNSRQEKADSLETGHAVTRPAPAPAPAPEQRGSVREAVRVPGRGGGVGVPWGPSSPPQGRAGRGCAWGSHRGNRCLALAQCLREMNRFWLRTKRV